MAEQARTTVADLRRRLDRSGQARRGTLGTGGRRRHSPGFSTTWTLVDEEGNPVARDDLHVDFGRRSRGTSHGERRRERRRRSVIRRSEGAKAWKLRNKSAWRPES